MRTQSLLCVDNATFVLSGILVHRPDEAAYEYFVIQARPAGGTLSFSLAPAPLPDLSQVRRVPLPEFPYPVKAYRLLAAALLGVPPAAPPSIEQVVSQPAADPRQQPVMGQWALLSLLHRLGIRWTQDQGQMADRVAGDLTGAALASVAGPPFTSFPLPFDFVVDPTAAPLPPQPTVRPIRLTLPIEPYRIAMRDAMTDLMAGDGSGAFDADDVKAFKDELRLAGRSDELNAPVKAGSHDYASAEYWTYSDGSAPAFSLQGFVGLLTFYNARDECWVAYLLGGRGLGTVLMEVAARGPGSVVTRTCPSGRRPPTSRRRDFYRKIGFPPMPGLLPRDDHGIAEVTAAFRLTL